MTAYAFETITAAQALAFASTDTLSLASGSAKTTTVLFLDGQRFSVTIGDRTVIFGAEFQFLASRLVYPDGSQLYVGAAQADVRDFGGTASTGAIFGGDGSDTLTGGSGDWVVQGNQGNDVIGVRQNGANVVYGGQGDDHLSAGISQSGLGPARQFMQGNKGADTIQGAGGGDTLLGGQGNDVIYGVDGQDFINGNLGDDQITGGGQLLGEGGDDIISVSATLASTVYGGDGNDQIQAGGTAGVATNHMVYGDQGNDTLGPLTDSTGVLSGGDGDDLIRIIQNAQFGVVSHGKLLDGGAGSDTLAARAGADTLVGGLGADSLSGGDGADLFVLDGAVQSLTFAAADTIGDWTVSDHLRLRASIGTGYAETTAADFTAALATAQAQIAAGQIEVVAVQVGSDVVVFTDASPGTAVDTITVLVGRTLADISRDSFI